MSALALLKIAMHARSGGSLEVMGLLQGKVAGDTFVVLDAFPLPVEGTETRVNAAAEANEFMIDYIEASKVCGSKYLRYSVYQVGSHRKHMPYCQRWAA